MHVVAIGTNAEAANLAETTLRSWTRAGDAVDCVLPKGPSYCFAAEVVVYSVPG